MCKRAEGCRKRRLSEAPSAGRTTMGEQEGKKPEDKRNAEETKKVEEAKVEDEKPKEKEEKKDGGAEGAGDSNSEGEKREGGDACNAEPSAPPPPPPEEIIMRVYMHCEACARKVKRSLKGFDGVDEVTTNCKAHKVVVKGKKAAQDPLKVVERVQKKSGRKVELLHPLPLPKQEKQEEEKKEDKPKMEEKKGPLVISVVLKVHMHCEACAQEIKKRILKMKGVQVAEPDLKSSQVLVKGIMDPSKLVDYVYKRSGKHAVIVKFEAADDKLDANAAKAGDKIKETLGSVEKKSDDGAGHEQKADGKKKDDGEKNDGAGGGDGGRDKEKDEGSVEDGAAGSKALELKRNEFCYYYPRYATEFNSYAPQLFSDENPNACSVM